MRKFRIGIDVGATNTKIGLFDREMNLLDAASTLTDQEADLPMLMDFIESLVRHMLKRNSITTDHLLGVGTAFPSYIDYKAGIVVETGNIIALTNAPVRDLLQERLGVRIVLDNDANLAALAEHRLGAGIGQDNMIYAALATGIGGGLILNGRLYRGVHGMAGEIGHMFISDSTGYSCPCGVTGCVQSIASGAYMAQYATDRIKEGEDSSILNYAGTLAGIDMEAVGKALRGGDPLALEVVSRGAEYLGRMFHSLNQIFDIDYFVYGGGVAKLGSPFIDRVVAAYRRYSINDARHPAQFVPAKFGNQAGMYGAALLITDEA